MRMHDPAHPGQVLREWLPEGMTVTQAAQDLHVARVTLSKVLNGQAGISAVMARRLAIWLGTSPDMWALTIVDAWTRARALPAPRYGPAKCQLFVGQDSSLRCARTDW